MNLFNKNKTSTENIKTTNPYLDAKREWMEHYGDYIAQKRNWQLVAIISILVALVSVFFVGYIGSQNKLIPYIIEVDKFGNTNKVGMVKNTKINDAGIYRYSINTFITSWRSIWGNAEMQRKFIFDTYNYIENKSDAFNFLNNDYIERDPFGKLDKENIKVKVTSIIQLNPQTWQVEWEETITDKIGDILNIIPYRAVLQIKQIAPTTEEEILQNPLGIYIYNIDYSKILR